MDDLEGGLSARHGTALILTEAGYGTEAIDAFRRALEYIDGAKDRLEPHAADFARIGIHGGMASCYEQLGRSEEAVFHLRTAIGLSAESGNTGLQSRDLHRLGVMLLDMGRPADARATFSRVIALGPSADQQTVREAAAQLEALDAVSI